MAFLAYNKDLANAFCKAEGCRSCRKDRVAWQGLVIRFATQLDPSQIADLRNLSHDRTPSRDESFRELCCTRGQAAHTALVC